MFRSQSRELTVFVHFSMERLWFVGENVVNLVSTEVALLPKPNVFIRIRCRMEWELYRCVELMRARCRWCYEQCYRLFICLNYLKIWFSFRFVDVHTIQKYFWDESFVVFVSEFIEEKCKEKLFLQKLKNHFSGENSYIFWTQHCERNLSCQYIFSIQRLTLFTVLFSHPLKVLQHFYLQTFTKLNSIMNVK